MFARFSASWFSDMLVFLYSSVSTSVELAMIVMKSRVSKGGRRRSKVKRLEEILKLTQGSVAVSTERLTRDIVVNGEGGGGRAKWLTLTPLLFVNRRFYSGDGLDLQPINFAQVGKCVYITERLRAKCYRVGSFLV